MWSSKDEEKLKIAMIKKYGEVNYCRLAKELGTTRQSLYNYRTNRNDSVLESKLKEWIKK